MPVPMPFRSGASHTRFGINNGQLQRNAPALSDIVDNVDNPRVAETETSEF